MNYEVRVWSLFDPDVCFAYIPYASMSFSDVLSDLGSAECEFDIDNLLFQPPGAAFSLLDPEGSPLYSKVLDEQHLWKVYQDGVHVFTFMPEETDENHINDAGDRVVKVSGRHAGLMLEWGTILPPNYPSYTPKHLAWHFTAETAAHCWITLFNEADARGAGSGLLTRSFTTSDDSASNPWADVQTLVLQAGGDLLQMFQQFMESASAEWWISPDLEINAVQPTIGVDRATGPDQLKFWIGYDQILVGAQRERRAIRNSVYTMSADGHVPHPTPDAGSILKWGRREGFFPTSTAAENDTANHFANVMMQQTEFEQIGVTVRVAPDVPGKIPFVDYGVGDTCWINSEDPRLVGPNRIVGISIGVDNESNVSVELQLQTALQSRLARLQQAYERTTQQNAWLDSRLQSGASSEGGAGAGGSGTISGLAISELSPGSIPLGGDESVPVVQDGATVKVPASAFGGGLTYAKQMYGTANDPGGGAPLDPWNGDNGGIFDKSITDPNVDDGGWISYQLENAQYVAVTRGLDPRADYGYLDEEFYNSNTFSPGDHSGWYFDYEVYLGLSAGGGPPWTLVDNVLGMMNHQADVDSNGEGSIQWFITAQGADAHAEGDNDLTISADVIGKADPAGGYYGLGGGWGSRFRIKVGSTQTRDGAFIIRRDDLNSNSFNIGPNAEFGILADTVAEPTSYTGKSLAIRDPDDLSTIIGYIPIME